MEIKKIYDEHGITYMIDGVEISGEIKELVNSVEKIDNDLFKLRKERCSKERNLITLLYGHTESNKIFEQTDYEKKCLERTDAEFYVIPKVISHSEREPVLDYDSFSR